MLIETDVLLAVINPNDPLRGYARKVFDLVDLLLSPFSLLELHLLARARKLEIINFEVFARDLATLLALQGIRILSDDPRYHSEAAALESGFGLTFFDSLHAAVAKREHEVIASFDRSYDRLGKVGVKRLDPKQL